MTWLHTLLQRVLQLPSDAGWFWALISISNLGSSSFSIISFSLFILFMELSRQEDWRDLPLPSPVDYILSELSTMTHPSWVALHGMVHSFIQLDKALIHVISLISFLWLWFSRSAGAQYATEEEWRNNTRKNEETEPKRKQYPIVDMTGDRSKVQCCKQQYCIGNWNVRSMN